jgi:spoIIIJ-associated protein
MSETTSTGELTTDELTTHQPRTDEANAEPTEEAAPAVAPTAEVGAPEAAAGTDDGRGSHTPTPSSDAGDEPLDEAGDMATDDTPGDDTPGDDAPVGAGDLGAPGKGSRVRQLEREGEVAADFLETLLDIADLDGDLDVDVDGDRAAVAIVDSDEGRVPRRLVGQDGKVLEALQELTRLAVQAETGERSRLMLDIAGYRAERRTALVELATSAIAEVTSTGEKKALDPMSAFERKVVHDEVAAAGLSSESEGTDPRRYVVILPA